METCPGPNISQYKFSFQTGSAVNSENVSTSRCSAGRCSHTFELPTNPPSSYDSVSVAAENVVGVGAARTCTTQTISESYSLTVITITKHVHVLMIMLLALTTVQQACMKCAKWVWCGWGFVCHRFANTLLIVLSFSKK